MWEKILKPVEIFNADCIKAAHHIHDCSVDLLICDPPFGIKEAGFDKHYARNQNKVLSGYVEAPDDYAEFTRQWMSEGVRVLNRHGSMFVIIGHTNLKHVLNSADYLGIHEVNHLIWKYNFGNNTTRKFVTSHYHILYYTKSTSTNRTFNTNCRFGSHERNEDGYSMLYADLEDVFCIKKEYHHGKSKNQNKLPDALIEKIILYCSKPGDVVGDFFLGNFTTANVAKSFGRIPVGFEMNKNAYDVGIKKLSNIVTGKMLKEMPDVKNIKPANQGKPLDDEEKSDICRKFAELIVTKTKKDAIANICEEFGRGYFSIINILKDNNKLVLKFKKHKPIIEIDYT
jgi:site-specific DNA-methyltransferase (adenine-specific)